MDHACGIWTYFVRCSLSMVFRFELKIVAYQSNFNRICLLTKRMQNSLSFQSFLWWPGRDHACYQSNRFTVNSFLYHQIRSTKSREQLLWLVRNSKNETIWLCVSQSFELFKGSCRLELMWKFLFWLCQLASLKSAIMSLPLLNRSIIELVLLLQCRYSLSFMYMMNM